LPEDTLGPLEFQLLAVLLEQPRDAYGMTIMHRIEERTGRKRSIPVIYDALNRLLEKGMVSSWRGEPTAKRGGRRKRYYRIEELGVEAVRRTLRTFSCFGVALESLLNPLQEF
jgi:DNA-binding PadR family transcriptional regulator